jgi:3'-phosphoadenosine 5'-phosphosulfate (PAPS) 3'-phosphatase
MAQSHFYQEETFLTTLIYIIKEANEILREERSPNMTIEEKIDSNGRKSKVTSGDLKTNEFIMKRLQELNQTLADDNVGFYNIISEEIAEAPFEERNSSLIDGSWCVDPLDGTADYCNFELETPSYTCNIGLIIDGDPSRNRRNLLWY